MPRLRFLLCVLAVAVSAALAAGCGDDEEDETTVTETVRAETATAGTAGAETTTEGIETTAGGGNSGPGFFSTPSENIGCHISAKAVRCDIREKEWEATPPSERCELDYGQGIVLVPDHAEFVCAGDTTLGAPKTLPYGGSSRRGPFLCESATDGVTCSNTENGAGFFISRQSFRIF